MTIHELFSHLESLTNARYVTYERVDILFKRNVYKFDNKNKCLCMQIDSNKLLNFTLTCTSDSKMIPKWKHVDIL